MLTSAVKSAYSCHSLLPLFHPYLQPVCYNCGCLTERPLQPPPGHGAPPPCPFLMGANPTGWRRVGIQARLLSQSQPGHPTHAGSLGSGFCPEAGRLRLVKEKTERMNYSTPSYGVDLSAHTVKRNNAICSKMGGPRGVSYWVYYVRQRKRKYRMAALICGV